MTDDDVEKIIKRNMNLQMNLAGIRADFEEAQQRTWVGLTHEECFDIIHTWNRLHKNDWDAAAQMILMVESKLKEKNT